MTLIRREHPGDAAAIRRVHLEAFGQADEGEIVDRIRENCAEDVVSLVAVEEGTVVGHILFSPVKLEGEEGVLRGMGLAPMAVAPESQRQGIGSQLVKAGIATIREASCPFVVVLGHPDYYPRFGFEPASRRGIRCEWDVPDEVFMIRVLDETEMGEASGLARYRPEFLASAG